MKPILPLLSEMVYQLSSTTWSPSSLTEEGPYKYFSLFMQQIKELDIRFQQCNPITITQLLTWFIRTNFKYHEFEPEDGCLLIVLYLLSPILCDDPVWETMIKKDG